MVKSFANKRNVYTFAFELQTLSTNNHIIYAKEVDKRNSF